MDSKHAEKAIQRLDLLKLKEWEYIRIFDIDNIRQLIRFGMTQLSGSEIMVYGGEFKSSLDESELTYVIDLKSNIAVPGPFMPVPDMPENPSYNVSDRNGFFFFGSRKLFHFDKRLWKWATLAEDTLLKI